MVEEWLHIMLIKRVFGGQSDGTLSKIRQAFTEDISQLKIDCNISSFPDEKINSKIKRDISIGEEFIEDILKTQKDDRYAFSILALLSPQLDYENNDFHKDHLHPISDFRDDKKLTGLNIDTDERDFFTNPEWYNSIINLQMLSSNENTSKQNKPLKAWYEDEVKSKAADLLRERCCIPEDMSLELKDFSKFAVARKQMLTDKLFKILK